MFVTLRNKVAESFKVREMFDIGEPLGASRPQSRDRGIESVLVVGVVGSAISQFWSAVDAPDRGPRRATPARSAARSKREFTSNAYPCAVGKPVAGLIA
jgi:hypothetical protein